MMKDNTGFLGERLLSLDNKMKALEEAGIGGAELRKVRDEVAVQISENRKIFRSIMEKKFQRDGRKLILDSEEEANVIADLIISFYEKYDAGREGGLFPYLTKVLFGKIVDQWHKKFKKLPPKYQEEGKPTKYYQVQAVSFSESTRTYGDDEESSEYIIPDKKMNLERDVVAAHTADEAFLNLSALVTRFFEERDRRSGTQKGFRYYKAVYTQGIFDYLKDGLENPPEFQHEVDIIRAADEAFANFVTLHHPYSDKEPLEIRKIFFNDLEYNRAVAPSYVKNVYPDEVIAIPMKPFVIGGYMERVHHMQVSASLVSQQMNRYERDAAEVLHRIGIESKRYKEKTEEKDD